MPTTSTAASRADTPQHEPAQVAPAQELSLARRIARFARTVDTAQLDAAVLAKAHTCLFDCIAGALASRDLPWSRQAIDYALAMGDTGATLIGQARTASWSEAAFANASMAHGLVQEDMHTASVSHIGVVIIPALFALAERSRASGADFVAAMIVGYQVMARLGQAVVNRESARTYRPLGMTGAVGAAAAGARLLRLSEEEAVNAIALAANTVAGFNEWPRTGGSEMFFHAGFAARNGLTCVLLAQAGARGAESAIDGPGGMLAAFRVDTQARRALDQLDGALEIMAVYHKPAPVCNFAQTPGQAALALAASTDFAPGEVRAILVKSFPQAIDYPGCAHSGPFTSTLQAKMSIPFAVASALTTRQLTEDNYREPGSAPANALTGMVRLEADPAFAGAFPQTQGAEVCVELRDGRRLSKRLDALTPLDAAGVRRRCQDVLSATLGEPARAQIDAAIEAVQEAPDMAPVVRMLRAGA